MIIGEIETKAGLVKKVATILDFKDKLGAVKVRWSIGRNKYTVEPGLYAVGNPSGNSDVFVSANYKLSFDHVRKNLDGLDAWILVLDTKGINVWCAAGKGTFGTNELVHRINETQLDKIVSHRRLIVPQLGATGVSAHQVKKLTAADPNLTNQPRTFQKPDFSSIGTAIQIEKGFNVVFGPVRASDIKTYIGNGYKATDEMRKVTFNFSDRLKLIPVDFVYARYKLLAVFALFFILAGLNRHGFDVSLAVKNGIAAIINLFLAYIAGIVLTPLLLPWLPFRMFGFKGLISGLILSAMLFFLNHLGTNIFSIISWFLIIAGISSFMAMNFTGSSTYTSLTGVKKEMRVFVPIQIIFATAGLVLYTVGNFKL